VSFIYKAPTISYPVTSVSNSDGSLTISPTTGDVIASINTAHANTWTAEQKFNLPGATYSPQPTPTVTINFVSGSSFLGDGSTYSYYVYPYYTSLFGNAYDQYGTFQSASIPNDSNFYDIEVTWSAATDANAYYVYDAWLSTNHS
jgi:hypothetical protein